MNHPARLALLGLSLALVVLQRPVIANAQSTQPAASAPDSGSQSRLVTRLIPSTRVTLTMPRIWKRLRFGAGYGDEKTGVESNVVEVNYPFQAVSKGMQPGGELTKQYTIDTRKEVKIEGRDGLLIRGTIKRKDVVEARYWLAFGNAASTVVVSAWYPMEKESAVDGDVQEMLMSASWNTQRVVDGNARLPFTFTLPSDLKYAGLVGENVAYTTTGKMGLEKPTSSLVRALAFKHDLNPVTADEVRRQFERVGANNKFKILTFEPVTVGDLNGFEGIAELTGTSRGAPVILNVYLIQLFDGNVQYNIFGQAGAEEMKAFLPQLKAAGRSIKRKTDAEMENN